jgi:ABC-2 type transport system permease protein
VIRNILAITERELRAYFVSPVAWLVAAFFVALWGILFAAIVLQGREAVLRPLLSNLSITFLLGAPLITMRLIAEEARTGTLELLLTQPIREVELVLGKYLAAVVFLLFLLFLTLYFPLLLQVFGNPDRGPMISGYLGVFLQWLAFLGIGLVASSLSQNQIVAGVITFAVLLMLWLSDILAGSVLSGVAADVARYISMTRRFEDMSRGVIDTKDIVFFLTVVVGCLFVSTQIITSRRWR